MKDGKSRQGLRVVSFVHQENDEKQGRYEEYNRRRMERSLQPMALRGYVNTISGGELHQRTLLITFLDQDLEMIKLPHANPLVIKLWISNTVVSRVLVNEGNSLDILLWKAF